MTIRFPIIYGRRSNLLKSFQFVTSYTLHIVQMAYDPKYNYIGHWTYEKLFTFIFLDEF